ncbi:MAG: hypothetical protein ACRD10_15085 [Terriglobia bacterium]
MTQTRRQIKTFPSPFATLALLAMAVAISAILYYLSRLRDFNHHVPQFIALSLVVGAIYLTSVYLVEQRPLGRPALFVILAAAAVFRLILLPVKPPLSDDVYRYQWEGKVQALSINPYTVYPAQPDLQKLQDPEHSIRTAATIPSAYPPLSEISFTWSRTISGYKNLYTAFDLATAVILLLILGSLRQPLHRALTYVWNPAVLIAFSLCGHQDSLAIFTLMAACLLIIVRKPLVSNAFLAL